MCSTNDPSHGGHKLICAGYEVPARTPEFAGETTLARTVHVRMLSASYLPLPAKAASTDTHNLSGLYLFT